MATSSLYNCARDNRISCGVANAADPKIRIFSGTDEHWVPLQVAKTKGYFAAEGLDAEVTVFTTGAAATEAFRAGRGDFISAGDLPSAAMGTSGNVVGLAPMSSDTEIFGIVGKKTSIRHRIFVAGRSRPHSGLTGEFLLYRYLPPAECRLQKPTLSASPRQKWSFR